MNQTKKMMDVAANAKTATATINTQTIISPPAGGRLTQPDTKIAWDEKMETTKVVGLIILKEDKVLIEKRESNKKAAPGKIVIPGGHVEKGESLEETCKRELKEELDISCSFFDPIATETYSLETENQEIHYFHCKDWKGNIDSKEAEEVFWVDQGNLDRLDYPKEKKLLGNFLN